jgi:hypothetical protein
MIRVPVSVRSLVRIVSTCSIAGLVLASCATATVATPHVTGLPAISISVPLSTVACTTDNSCVAIGTSNLNVSPTSVGEYRSPSGRWSSLTVPSADSSTYVQSASCWNNGCLFVGSHTSGAVVWRYDAASHSIAVEQGPPGPYGIATVSCYAAMTCAVLDSSKNGPQFLTTDNGGATWSSPVTFTVLSNDTVSSLSCTSKGTCMASFLNSSNGIDVYVSSNAGATWTLRTGFSTITWAALTSLNCDGRACVGLAKLFSGWRVERTDNLGRSWTRVASISYSPYAMACTRLDRCVVGGLKGSSLPWLSVLSSGKLTSAKLKYIPSPISDIACGSTVCAAIGVTTVIALRP